MSIDHIEAGVVEGDLPCDQCGYNLRTLAVGGACPECACSIARSIQVAREGVMKGLSGQSAGWVSRGGVAFLAYLLIGHLMPKLYDWTELIGAPPLVWQCARYVMDGLLIACSWVMTRRPRSVRALSGRIAAITRVILCSASAWPVVRGVLGIAGVSQASNTFPAIGFLLKSLATVVAFIWFFLLACQMRHRKLAATCLFLAGYALIMVWFSVQFSVGAFTNSWLGPAWWPQIFPDLPILGPLWNIDWSFQFEGERTLHLLPSMMWVCASSVTLAIFGIAFLRSGLRRTRPTE
jgi:hypothetical protein